MALAGIHVISGYAGFAGYNNSDQSLFGKAEWHEIIAAPGDGTKFAGTQQNPNAYGKPVFRFYAVADSLVRVGKPAALATAPKHFVKAGEYYDVTVLEGDTWAWELA